MSHLRAYYILTKPGIIYGNALTAVAGFLFASKGHTELGLFFATLIGIALVIAAACVWNNYIDRHLDKKMSRTKNRPLVTGEISTKNALIYGGILAVIGMTVLVLFVNMLVVVIGLVALVFYLVLYGVAKRQTVYSTLVGSIPGAASIVAGYVAAKGGFDLAAAVLGLIMIIWQMPHFYSIAIFRKADYARAGLPVLPVKYPIQVAKIHIFFYVVLFTLAIGSLTVLGYTGYVYLTVLMVLCSWWLLKAFQGLHRDDDITWARGMFGTSLLVLLTFSIMIAIDHALI